jgi:hypothetical protein
MQICRFDVGKGFVIHKIELQGNRSLCYYSAWYAEDGTLLDCEQMYPRCGDVSSNHTAIRSHLQSIGRRHAPRLFTRG